MRGKKKKKQKRNKEILNPHRGVCTIFVVENKHFYRLDSLLEVISDRVKIVATVFFEQVGDPCAPSASPDQADFDPALGEKAILGPGDSWHHGGGHACTEEKPARDIGPGRCREHD